MRDEMSKTLAQWVAFSRAAGLELQAWAFIAGLVLGFAAGVSL